MHKEGGKMVDGPNNNGVEDGKQDCAKVEEHSSALNLTAAEESFEVETRAEKTADGAAEDGMAHLSDEQRAALRDQLGSVTTEIATQMMSIQEEMKNMKSQLYADSGLNGIKAQLEALRLGEAVDVEALVADAQEEATKIATSPKNSTQVDKTPVQQNDGVFRVDTLVDSRWQGGNQSYPARIHRVNEDGTFDLHYADGGRERNVSPDNVRHRIPGNEPASVPEEEGVDDSTDTAKDGFAALDKTKVPGVKADGSFDPGEFDKFMKREYAKKNGGGGWLRENTGMLVALVVFVVLFIFGPAGQLMRLWRETSPGQTNGGGSPGLISSMMMGSIGGGAEDGDDGEF
jgi:hypothetical protein